MPKLRKTCFLVGALSFPLKEKCPTIAVTFFSFFSSDYNPHTERSTFLTTLTILKSYNSYLANLKYWRKSLRSSIFTSSKKLKGTKGHCLRVFSALRDFFFEKKFPKGSSINFLEFSDRTDDEKSKGSLSVFSAL